MPKITRSAKLKTSCVSGGRRLRFGAYGLECEDFYFESYTITNKAEKIGDLSDTLVSVDEYTNRKKRKQMSHARHFMTNC